MSYIRTKFHGNNFYGFKSTNQGDRNLQRGIIPCVKTVGGVMVLFSAHCLIMMYICIVFHENILTLLVLSTLSDDAHICTKFCENVSKGFGLKDLNI